MTRKQRKWIGLVAGSVVGAFVGSALGDVILVHLLDIDSPVLHNIIVFISAFTGGVFGKSKF
jgi:hypothetical protein